jgi:hypothetical protein
MAEKKHESLNPTEAQRLAFNQARGINDAETKALRVRYEADKALRALAAAEEELDALLPPEDVDRRGAKFRRAQAADDAQLVGFAAARGQSGHAVTDPAVRESAQRLRARAEHHDSAAALEKAQREYDSLAAAAAFHTANLAAANHRAAIEKKQADLAWATSKWRETPANGELAAEVKRLQAEVEQLIQNPPKQ